MGSNRFTPERRNSTLSALLVCPRGLAMHSCVAFPPNPCCKAIASRALVAALMLAAAAPVSTTTSRAAEHTLLPSPQTVHIGYFLATVKPVLTIDSGDIVTLESVPSIVPSVIDQSGVVP